MSPINGSLPTNSPQPSENTNAQKTQERLNTFCEQHCPGVPQDKMYEMIKEGKALVELMANAAPNNADWANFLKQKATPKAAVCLMWYLTSKAAEQDDLFTAGAMRVGKGDPINGAKLEEFLKACGTSYARVSTHMEENIPENHTSKIPIFGKLLGLFVGKGQYGLDLRNDLLPENNKLGAGEMLPAGKQTILFAQQPDGTLYLKLEEHGCPPFWSGGFNTTSHFKEYVGHAIDYITTRPFTQFVQKHTFKVLSKLGLSKEFEKNELATRKEKVPENVKKSFKKAITDSNLDKKEKLELIKEGNKFGISRMKKILDEKDIQDKLVNEHIGKKPPGYIGEVRGNEVLLPSLGPAVKP